MYPFHKLAMNSKTIFKTKSALTEIINIALHSDNHQSISYKKILKRLKKVPLRK